MKLRRKHGELLDSINDLDGYFPVYRNPGLAEASAFKNNEHGALVLVTPEGELYMTDGKISYAKLENHLERKDLLRLVTYDFEQFFDVGDTPAQNPTGILQTAKDKFHTFTDPNRVTFRLYQQSMNFVQIESAQNQPVVPTNGMPGGVPGVVPPIPEPGMGMQQDPFAQQNPGMGAQPGFGGQPNGMPGATAPLSPVMPGTPVGRPAPAPVSSLPEPGVPASLPPKGLATSITPTRRLKKKAVSGTMTPITVEYSMEDMFEKGKIEDEILTKTFKSEEELEEWLRLNKDDVVVHNINGLNVE